jgi:hypothetical protein
LASRDFTHLPGSARLGDPRFKVDLEAALLSIELDVNNSQAISSYRIVLEDGSTQAVALDVQQPGPPPLGVSLDGIPAGDYLVTVVALDGAGRPLTQVSDKFVYAAGAPLLGSPLFEYRNDTQTLLIRLEPQGGQAFALYQVSLVDSASNQVVLDYEAPADGPQIAVPLKGLPAGSFLVLIRALDASGALFAETQGETTYNPPPAPSTLSKILAGMAASPLIPILIVIVLLAAIGGLALHAYNERRATATPVLQGWGQGSGSKDSLPLNRTVVHDPQVTLSREPENTQPLEMTLTIASSPDKKYIGKSIHITRYPFTMGRFDSDLSLTEDEHISRRHAELHFDEHGLFILDRLSSNGTYVNGERIASDQPVQLDPRRKNRIQLGRETQLVLSPTLNRPA